MLLSENFQLDPGRLDINSPNNELDIINANLLLPFTCMRK